MFVRKARPLAVPLGCYPPVRPSAFLPRLSVRALGRAGGLLCLDEPDNFVTLAEIQPLLFRLQDLAEERGTQVLLVSHNSEVIDYLGPDRARLFSRDEAGPVHVGPFEAPGKLGMNPSQVLARGWEE